jgi:hypothetical protein
MNSKLIKKIKEAGLDPRILTAEEIKQLEKEMDAEKEGKIVLDGVLSNPELYYRNLKK